MNRKKNPQSTTQKRKKKKNIIQSKIWLFAQKEHFNDHKDLPKLEKEVNDWCKENEVENGDNTILNWELVEGYVVVTLVYSKVF